MGRKRHRSRSDDGYRNARSHTSAVPLSSICGIQGNRRFEECGKLGLHGVCYGSQSEVIQSWFWHVTQLYAQSDCPYSSETHTEAVRLTQNWCGRGELNPHEPRGPTDFLTTYGFRRPYLWSPKPTASLWSGLYLHHTESRTRLRC